MMKSNLIDNLFITHNTSILDALKIMDEKRRKLLIVVDHNNKYKGLLSIGDLQRAIIADLDMKTHIDKIIKKEQIVSFSDENQEYIKKIMEEIRCEFMPVLERETKELRDVIFWEDIFVTKKPIKQVSIKLPVVIMAGGKGTRLKPITNILPKPLVPIGDKTIVEYIMDKFVAIGCGEFHLSVNYKVNMIKNYFEELNSKQYNINYFMEEKPLGTAGSLFLLKGKINSTFFVSNCDIIIDEDYNELYKYHKNNGNEITLVAAIKHYKIPYGTIESGSGGLLNEMNEKPELTFKINSGMYILEPHLLNEIPENEFFHITELIEQVKKRNGKVGVFPISEGSWLDIGEWPEYIKTVRMFSEDPLNFQGL